MPAVIKFLVPSSGLDWIALCILLTLFLTGLEIMIFHTKIEAPEGLLLFGDEIEEKIHIKSAGFVLMLPSLLLVIGLLFTFLGLGLAISQAASALQSSQDAGSTMALVEKLKAVLGLVGLKFKASVWGILLHLVALAMASRIHQQKREKLVDYLGWRDSRLRGQVNIFEGFLKSLQTSNENILLHFQGMDATAKSLEMGASAIAASSDRLAGEIRGYKGDTVQAVLTVQQSMENIAKAHADSMERIGSGHLGKLEESIRLTNSLISEIGVKTENLFNASNEFREKVSSGLTTLYADSHSRVEALYTGIQERHTGLSQQTIATQRESADAASTLLKNLGLGFTSELATVRKVFLEEIQGFRTTILEDLQTRTAAIVHTQGEMEAQLRGLIGEFHTQLGNHLTQASQLGIKEYGELRAFVASTRVDQLAAFQSLDTKTLNTMAKLQQETAVATQCTRDLLTQVEATVERIHKAAIGECAEQWHLLSGGLSEQFGQALTSFTNAGTTLSTFQKTGLADLNKAQVHLNTTLEQAMNKLGVSVEATRGQLAVAETTISAFRKMIQQISPVLSSMNQQLDQQGGLNLKVADRLSERQDELRLMLAIVAKMIAFNQKATDIAGGAK